MFEVNNFLSFAVHGAQGKHGGVAGSVEHLLAFLESLTDKSGTEIFSLLMPGISAMENIHPLFVHFPIAFFTAFVLLDIAGTLFIRPSWRTAASWFLYLGTVTAAATVAAGLAAAATVAHGDNVHAIMEKHEHLAIAVLTLSVVLSFWRLFAGGAPKGGGNVFFLISALILLVLLLFTADLGGLMVYKYGVSVESARTPLLDYFHEHQHSH